MAMVDKIWQGTGSIPSEPTQLLPINFFAPVMPVSLEIEDIFNVKGSAPTDGSFRPVRSFFLEDINAYLLFDVGEPTMVAIYLYDNDTKEMLASYTYMAETCPVMQKNDRFVDCCVHHDDMTKEVHVSLLIVNDAARTAVVARFALQIEHLLDPSVEAGNEAFLIKMSDMTFFADLIPPGAKDAIALPFSIASVATFGDPPTVYHYPDFSLVGVLDQLRDTFHCGTINHKYCTLTVDEAGRYVALVGSRITCYVGPNLAFPVDVQYIIIMDQGGMNHRCVFLGPYKNFMCWDETEEHQPTKFNATVFDGRYVLCLEERRSRYIAPARASVSGMVTEPPTKSYPLSTKDWYGGAVADVYYPPRSVQGSVFEYQVEVGYPSVWDDASVLEPIPREYIWTMIDLCALYAAKTPTESTSNDGNWWDEVAQAWRPQVLYNFNPVKDPDHNSLVTIFDDTISYVMNGYLVRTKVNYLTVYDDDPANGGMPQNAIYIPGLIPGEDVVTSVIIKNESLTGIMKQIELTLDDIPADVTITMADFPDKLDPQEMVTVTLTVSYAPTGSPVSRHIDAKYKVKYWMQHILTCKKPVVVTPDP